MPFKINLPNKEGNNTQFSFETENNIVFVGANGSGKTRLGAFISAQKEEVFRISAQRFLSIPTSLEPKAISTAQQDLKNKFKNLGQGNASVNVLNNYTALITLIFALQNKRDSDYVAEVKENTRLNIDTNIPIPEGPVEIIEKIWTDVLPHSIIHFKDHQIFVVNNNTEIKGRELSDGERVILYLIAQCIVVSDQSIIIIDEPEIHLHKSIISTLYNKIEQYCKDKLIIYITHDLDFAASRTDCHKFWIKSYNGGTSWNYEEINDSTIFPEPLLLEILGTRKKIIFCEGEYGSYDVSIYELVYPDFNVIPRGGADKVIEATKALRNNQTLHHLDVFGIIDSDYKENEEIDSLKSHGIFTISVAEIENLFCIEPILRIIAQHQAFTNIEEQITKVIDFLINELVKEFDVQVSSKAERIIQYKLQAYTKNDYNLQGIKGGLNDVLSSIDVDKIYEECRALFQDAIDSKDLKKLLLVYNRKSLPDRISTIFHLSKGAYSKLLIRLMKGDKKDEIIAAFKNYLPVFDKEN
ncbi:DUF4435 domain-containing protein [Flavobacterium salilacus subsp. salilacus]|uniref:DUF4435 domain-containing protein n=1 Tax=Flavobacterium TaxID=237 RepID=UPI0010754D72|nr:MULTISPECIES: DUF4435 domain-containing protein [Flavobacterium]KAF2519680.1 DUF4435 domain-containing protein [Flavobacterium salilacus subsp. salilacus]MBE1614433.1 DUF4435 domain-containing protein [Flavobacterium sp. SaA2.13]